MRPNDRKYLKSHEWMKRDGDTALIGISDFAVSQLSDLTFLDPSRGRRHGHGRRDVRRDRERQGGQRPLLAGHR
jgi:glycine cleavage system H lipoate-binding protein